jgi:hypothetical protein
VDVQQTGVQLDGFAGLPPELVTGALLGLAGTCVVVLAFVLAERLLPASGSYHRYDTGGESRRRSEFRDYLDAIDEQYAEDHPVSGQSVAFYLPERDVAITFDPKAYYRIERTETVPILVEHEMPGSALGSRLPFETPEVEFGEDDDRDPIRGAFAELGVPVTASIEEVTQAYRQRVKEVHPDQGGDEAEFKRVREAYTTAKEHADGIRAGAAD